MVLLTVNVLKLHAGLSALDKTTPVTTFDAAHQKATINNTLKVLISFALVERCEGENVSPTNSYNIKRGVDKRAEYLDILRVHSVVQAFFVDSLREQRQVDFWLQRATDIWCRSYDEADRRIQADPKVGLPDDYRRFRVHGKKLLQNLDRFEKRYPELAEARSPVERRLDEIQEKIDLLSHAIQKSVLEGTEGAHPISVFDRAGVSSQSDASTTFESQSSWESQGDAVDQFESPMPLPMDEALLAIPYPTIDVMPAVPEISDDDWETLVQSSTAGTQVYLPEIPLSTSISGPHHGDHGGDLLGHSSASDGSQEGSPSHRVTGRQGLRRDRDPVSIRRVSTLSDSQVGLCRVSAEGSISSRRVSPGSPSGPDRTERSEAEHELIKIMQAPPPSSWVPQGSVGSAALAQPEILPWRNSSARPQTQRTPRNGVAVDPPAQPKRGLGQVLSMAWRLMAATVRKLTGLTPPQSPRAAETPAQPQPRAYEDRPAAAVIPGPIFQGDRSVNSHLANNATLMAPPLLPVFLADERATPTSTKTPVLVRHWNTVVQYPGEPPVSSSGTEWWSSADPMSLSLPALPLDAQQQPPRQPGWLPTGTAAGDISEPMASNTGTEQPPRFGTPPPDIEASYHHWGEPAERSGAHAEHSAATAVPPSSSLSSPQPGRRRRGATGTTMGSGSGSTANAQNLSAKHKLTRRAQSLFPSGIGARRSSDTVTPSIGGGGGSSSSNANASRRPSPFLAPAFAPSPLLPHPPPGPPGATMTMAGYQHQHQHPRAEWTTLAIPPPPADDAPHANPDNADPNIDRTGTDTVAGPAAAAAAVGSANRAEPMSMSMSRSSSGGSGRGTGSGIGAGILIRNGTVVEFGTPGLGGGGGAAARPTPLTSTRGRPSFAGAGAGAGGAARAGGKLLPYADLKLRRSESFPGEVDEVGNWLGIFQD